MVCQDAFVIANGLSATVNLTLPAATYSQQFGLTNFNPAWQAAQGVIHLDLGTTPSAGFTADVWIMAGPGPTFTAVQQLVAVSGTVATGTRFCGQWGRNQTLPIVNRPLDLSIDRIRFQHNAAYGAPTSGLGQMTFSLDPLSEFSTDCCAETLAKLDLIIGYVSKVFPPLA